MSFETQLTKPSLFFPCYSSAQGKTQLTDLPAFVFRAENDIQDWCPLQKRWDRTEMINRFLIQLFMKDTQMSGNPDLLVP